MSVRSTSRNALALGAALLACPLAASTAHGQMAFTTIDFASGYLGLGDQTASFVVASSTSFLAESGVTDQGAGSIGLVANNFAGWGDVIYALINVPSATTSGQAQGFFLLTFSSRVQFFDLSAFYGMSVNWSVNSVAFADGDYFEAGTHTIDWSFSGPFGSAVNSYGPMMRFEAAAGSVPLPGAAGLAACGLLAAGRRRRR